jgi:hypothetical protein
MWTPSIAMRLLNCIWAKGPHFDANQSRRSIVALSFITHAANLVLALLLTPDIFQIVGRALQNLGLIAMAVRSC